ncbi:hypothetical protein BDZ91DRAFT_790143 [Kalaharituber pfeilii]|nr:hypothetical protein BDZ91DRAFT_790143 [Kalaharituber pfeilii]
MKFSIIPVFLSTLFFAAIGSGSPIPQDVSTLCIAPPVIITSFLEPFVLVTSNPSVPKADGKQIYIARRIGIPENPPPSPLVTYLDEAPDHVLALNGTLEDGYLVHNGNVENPAQVAPVADVPGLNAVYYQDGITGTFGKFQIIYGCDILGHARMELWPAEGGFCIKPGSVSPEYEVYIKTTKSVDYPCIDVTLVVHD